MDGYCIKGSNSERLFEKEFLTFKNAMAYYIICKESGQWDHLVISNRYEGEAYED